MERHQGKAPTASHRLLLERIADLEKSQLEFLDNAGKRIVEVASALLGLFFAALAFGKQFPPPYLVNDALAQSLSIAVLLFFLGAILLAMRAAQPRRYDFYRNNLSAMRRELDRIHIRKSSSIRAAGWLFFFGIATFAALIATIILP